MTSPTPEVEVTGEELGAARVEVVPEPPRRLFLHIGLPKSGSTFLQSLLGENRGLLREHGFTYPYVRQEGMFHAALEMAGNPDQWGVGRDRVEGTFDHLVRRGRRLGGDVVLSHEIFSAANGTQAKAILDRVPDYEVHLVITVRNLAQTLTAQWQERVKNGHDQSFASFADDILDGVPEEMDDDMVGFWRGQNLLWVIKRWKRFLPPERIHLVVTPPGGTGPDVLWRRFCSAIGIPSDLVDVASTPRHNESLGVAQIAVMRHVLAGLEEIGETEDDRLEQPWYAVVAKRWFAQTVLSTARSGKPQAPAAVGDRLVDVTRHWIEVVERVGYPVHGDLAELFPGDAAPDARHPDDVAVEDMYAGLPRVIARMLLHVRDLRIAARDLETEKGELTRERDELAARVEELSGTVEELQAQRRRWPLPPRRA
ncbi:hypothetical protein [Nocardioides sp. 1609]|uniref:hypothetical protein n=1 Tax=Nocardioides sp. 1609 TaxID=2508327 RepID=UPI00106F2D04|nr:hypothetical protein [Nocardioides sp. 1609]